MSIGTRKKAAQSGCCYDSLYVGNTVMAFAKRMQLHLQEMQKFADYSNSPNFHRHLRVLQALTLTRKAFAEVTRYEVGNNYYFELHVVEDGGWPSIKICLVNSENSSNSKCTLRANVNDRTGCGTIGFWGPQDILLAKADLLTAESLDPFPGILDTALCSFLEGYVTPLAAKDADTISYETPKATKSENAAPKHTKVPSKQSRIVAPDDSALPNFDFFEEDAKYLQDSQVSSCEILPLDTLV